MITAWKWLKLWTSNLHIHSHLETSTFMRTSLSRYTALLKGKPRRSLALNLWRCPQCILTAQKLVHDLYSMQYILWVVYNGNRQTTLSQYRDVHNLAGTNNFYLAHCCIIADQCLKIICIICMLSSMFKQRKVIKINIIRWTLPNIENTCLR